MKNCIVCGELITQPRANKQYCGNACKQKAYRDGNDRAIDSIIGNKDEKLNTIEKGFNPEFVNQIILETMKEMQVHFSEHDQSDLNLFIFYKMKWNIRGEEFVNVMKWFSESELSLRWYYMVYNRRYNNEKPTKEEQIEYQNYCKFIYKFKANKEME